MGRSPCCDKNGLKKGPWTPEEDQKLIDYIQKHGYGNWRTLPKNAGLQRCGKSCRLRWTNYLRPDIKRGRFSFEEEETIIQLHSILGNKWSAIAARLPGRTDNEIKNYWNTHIRKRLLRMGIDPVTHSPRLDLLDLSSILGNSHFYNTNTSSPTSHINMSRLFGLQPLVNPDLLKLATSLMSNQRQNPITSTPIHDLHGNNEFTSNTQIHDNTATTITTQYCPTDQLHHNNFNPMLQTSTQIRTPLPTCTTMTTSATPSTTTDVMARLCAPLYNEAHQLMDPNFELYPTTIPNHIDHSQNLDQWDSNNDGLSMPQGFVAIQPNTCYYENNYGSHQILMDPSFSNNILRYPPSVMSTPSSSPTPLNSSSNSTTYVNSSGTEDEKESYCSDMIKFEIPDLLDVNHFLLAQTN